ncbi:MAG: insulinase family protein [Bacteroidota bacterium]|nr:insulinase family protein [Bacteroidota bacterium]
MNRSLNRSLVWIFLFLAATFAYGQTSTIDLTTPLAVDPNVKIGKLDNGLTYYIRQNKKPENRVELRLAVNAGSILERDDQQGLAHFMEHMNFNGTKTFPKNELVDFLQKTGVRFGADINAYTGFDETVYMLQLPTDDTTLINKGLQVLEDWAHNATLDDKEIDKERGVITEEWRMGLGAEDRMMKKYFPILLKNSQYAERIPIGKIDIIQNFKHQSLKDFYHEWYRPDLMAVVVVGDIDPAVMEARIKAHFSKMPNPANEKPRNIFDIPDNQDPLIAIATDKEATQNMVEFFYKHPLEPKNNLGDFRKEILAEIFTSMLNQRLGEISQKPDAPFVNAGTFYGGFLARNKEAYGGYSVAKENQIDKALATVLAESERVKRFGFTATEFERQKEDMLSKYEKAAKEFTKTESMDFTNEYVSNFLTKDPIPGAEKKYKYVKNLLPGITLEEVNNLAKEFVTENNLGVVITAPEKENLKVPTQEEVAKIIKDSRTAPLEPYVDKFKEEPLIAEKIQPTGILARKENKELGFTEVILSNHVTVVMKPTTFKNDEILVSAYSLGGKSLYPDNEFISANYASQIIDMSGAGKFDNIELQKKLKGKNIQISPYIEDEKEGFHGNSSPKDFETMLQLIYLYFEGPRKDTTAFQTFLSQTENEMKFMKSNPIMTFYDTLFKSAYPGYKRMIIFPSKAQLDEIKLDEVYKIYKDRFADASDFLFFFVGNFNVDSILPMVQTYLGNLPSINRSESFKDTSPKMAPGENNLTFYKGKDPQSMVAIMMSEPMEWGDKTKLELKMLKEIISIKLVEVIREKMSGVYSPMVMLNYDQYPTPKYQMIIAFGCSPQMTEKLTTAVFDEMNKIRKKGPTTVDLKKAQEALIRQRETDLEKNEFWLQKIESVFYNHDDPTGLATFKDDVNAITGKDLKKTAEEYFKANHYTRVVLMPEKQ